MEEITNFMKQKQHTLYHIIKIQFLSTVHFGELDLSKNTMLTITFFHLMKLIMSTNYKMTFNFFLTQLVD